METNLITLAKVVEGCAPRSPEHARLWRRRLRELTANNAVPAAERQHAGAGKHRLYDPEIIPLAAVLLRLSDSGVESSKLADLAWVVLRRQEVDQEVRKVWDTAWAYELSSHQEAWLALSLAPIDGDLIVSAGFSPVDLGEEPGDSAIWIVVYLSRIFRQIKAVG